jgi:protein tyrosine phosphatase type IVA
VKPFFLAMKIPFCVLPNPGQIPIDFALCDCPVKTKLAEYAEFFYANDITHIIRVCDDITYDAKDLFKLVQSASYEIVIHDQFKFEDGGVPSDEMALDFLDFIHELVAKNEDKEICVAVHCVSGLGRAPILICMSVLMYLPKWEPEDVVEWIRQYRRGAVNKKQLTWLREDFQLRLRRKARRNRSSPTKKPGLFDRIMERFR